MNTPIGLDTIHKITLNITHKYRSVSGSRIILVSPDPSAPLPERNLKNTRESDTDSVTFTPDSAEDYDDTNAIGDNGTPQKVRGTVETVTVERTIERTIERNEL